LRNTTAAYTRDWRQFDRWRRIAEDRRAGQRGNAATLITLVGFSCGHFGPALELLQLGVIDVASKISERLQLSSAPPHPIVLRSAAL
jgi:hypothetical protein